MPLHAQAQSFLHQLAQRQAPAWHQLSPAEGREMFAGFGGLLGEGPDLSVVTDWQLDHVPVRIYRPSTQANLPVVVYFHGGGWVLGDLDTHDALCRRLAQASGLVVIAVQYRLAPEHPYPAALEDCFSATNAVSARAGELGVDAAKLVVAGDSAGGNLAAAVCLKARDEGGPNIAGQVLIYPVVEPDFETESYLEFAIDHGLTRPTMQWFWQQYLDGSVGVPVYATLARANLAQLPCAHVITAEYDVLRSEGEEFARRLAAAGVPTSSKRYLGMLHGFVHYSPLFDLGVTAIAEITQVIQRMVQPGGEETADVV